MRIQCLLGPASTTVGSTTYEFTRDEDGRFVADVHDLVHVKCLLSSGVYSEPRPVVPDLDDDPDEDGDEDAGETIDDAGDEDGGDDTRDEYQPTEDPGAAKPKRRGGRRRRAAQ